MIRHDSKTQTDGDRQTETAETEAETQTEIRTESLVPRSNPNFKLFAMLIIRTLKNYPDSSDFLQLFRDFLGRERLPREDP